MATLPPSVTPEHPPPDETGPEDDGGLAADDAAEHDVLVHLRLSNRSLGIASERADIERLADELEAAVEAAGVGEYDGDEMGGGECTLFFAGADADRLFAVLLPLLQRDPLGRGARATLQYGGGEPQSRRI
ncbi:MAG: hypothetical protein AB7O97_15925 [Planctomycetota bacterium]